MVDVRSVCSVSVWSVFLVSGLVCGQCVVSVWSVCGQCVGSVNMYRVCSHYVTGLNVASMRFVCGRNDDRL